MNKSLKTVFSTFVSLTTIAWSVGVGTLVMPGVASAASISAGDLIKASGPAVYYYASDAKRYVFPNEKTYFSWYSDFSSVKTITDSELAAISIGGNVTVRPGTKLVKITTDPKVYAVTKCGTLHWIESEAVAKALYGDAWATRVIDVPDSFFVNYTVGSSIATNVHPDGTLISYTGDPAKYVVWNGAKRKFNPDTAFAANGYNPLNVITTTITYGNGSDVTGREADLADTVCTSGPVTSGNLTVALASDTPAGATVPKNSSSVPLVKVNLTAGSSDVTVTGLRFHRVGVGAVSDFANVYLYDQDGTRLTTGRSINSSTNLVEFNALNLTVPAGGMKSVYVYGDFSNPSSTGGQHAFELQDAASVVVNSGTVAGSFPVRGNVFTVGTTSAARVDIQKGSTPANPTIGAKEAEISNFKITANTNDVSVSQITLYQAGSITNSDLTNLKLYQGSTLVASAPAVSSNGRIVLKFSPAYVIANGTTKVFSLKADVAGRAGRTIRTYVEYTTDVSAMDLMYNAGASVNIATSPANFDGTGSNYIEVTTQGGQLTNSFNGPVTANVAKGQQGVVLYKFALTSPDNTLEVRNLRFDLESITGGTCALASTSTNYFRNIKVKNLDTNQTWMGPKEISGNTSPQALTFSDSQNIAAGQTINLAVVADLASSEDVFGQFFGNGNCQYRITFKPFQSNDIRVTDTGEFLDISKIVPNQTVQGNAMTVKSSNLTVALASSPSSDTLVKKQQNVPIAGLVLTASNESDITITNLTLTGQAALSGSGCNFGAGACAADNFDQRVTSLALFDGSTQVGLAKAPDTTTGKAQITNMNLLIPKGTSKTLTVKASFSSTASTTAPYDKVAVGVASANDITAQDQDSNTVTPSLDAAVTSQATGASPSVVITLLNSGTLTVQADAHPASTIVASCKGADTAKCPWVSFAQYKATAQYEDISIDRVAIYASSTAGLTADNADFRVVAIAANGAVKGSDILSAGTTGTKDIDLSANPIVVPKGSSVQFQIWAKLSDLSTSQTANGLWTGAARSGHAPALGLMTSSTGSEWNAAEYGYGTKLNIRSTGVASGERVYADTGAAHGNAQVLRASYPIVSKQALSSTTLANTDMDLIKFQVVAPSCQNNNENYSCSIAFKQAVFNVAINGTLTLSNFKLFRGSSEVSPTANYTIVDAAGNDLKTAGTVTTTGYVVVAFAPGNEDGISGTGNIYTLRATVSGANSGESVTISFYRDPNNALVTGYLGNGAVSPLGNNVNIYGIDTSAGGDGSSDSIGTFVWSDNSEVPHSPALGNAGGSRDWTNDLYVTDLNVSQQLSLN
jgi:hypothetical protein